MTNQFPDTSILGTEETIAAAMETERDTTGAGTDEYKPAHGTGAVNLASEAELGAQLKAIEESGETGKVDDPRPALPAQSTDTDQYTIVVFRTSTHSQMHANTVLRAWLGNTVRQPDELTEYWFAMDERYDAGDQDSAVLVPHGTQKDVQKALIEMGLSGEHNSSLC